jgi:hypothetical protein
VRERWEVGGEVNVRIVEGRSKRKVRIEKG